MASKRAKRRKLRSHQCTGKKQHMSRDAAYRAIFASMKDGLGWMRPYKCKFCGCWHIGHARNIDYNRRKG